MCNFDKPKRTVMNNIKDLIPKNKFDCETAEKLSDYSYEEIKSIIPNLLEWLQDINWPVGIPVAEFLISINGQITNEILDVFKTTDEVWKYCVIRTFGPVTQSADIKKEMERIAYFPTTNEHLEELDELCLEILKSRNWV